MRAPKERQSALRYPLNDLLSTETNVRVLRLLSEVRVPLGRSEVARRVGLAPSGVRRAVDRLVALGIIEAVGTGRRRPVRLREQHPLADTLLRLFRDERARFEGLMDDLRGAVRSVDGPIEAAWIESAIAQGTDEPGDVLCIGIVSSPDHVEHSRTDLDRRLVRIGGEHDVAIEARGYTPADLQTLRAAGEWPLDDVRLLYGLEPSRLLSTSAGARASSEEVASHDVRDRQSLELTRAVVERLERDPSLLEEARHRIARRIEEASPGETKELREWDDLLAHWSIPRIRDFLLSDSERAERLRQSLPFLHVLTQEEREDLLEQTGP